MRDRGERETERREMGQREGRDSTHRERVERERVAREERQSCVRREKRHIFSRGGRTQRATGETKKEREQESHDFESVREGKTRDKKGRRGERIQRS